MDKPTREITLEQFKQGLRAIGRSTKCTITAHIVPDMRATLNPYYGRTHKIVTTTGVIGGDYETSMNRALFKQGVAAIFEAQKHSWGEYVSKQFIKHPQTGELYIRWLENFRHEIYYVDNEPVDKSVLVPYLRVKPDTPVTYRNFALRNIISITWEGTVYVIKRLS